MFTGGACRHGLMPPMAHTIPLPCGLSITQPCTHDWLPTDSSDRPTGPAGVSACSVSQAAGCRQPIIGWSGPSAMEAEGEWRYERVEGGREEERGEEKVLGGMTVWEEEGVVW